MKIRPILIVEDDPRDLELALAALARCNLANPIEVARDGVEALDFLYRTGRWLDRGAGDPAVVLLDMKLPRIDGIELLERIKSDAMLKQVPVVMLTASREESDLVRSYELGANAFVVKPVDFDEYLATIQELGMFWGNLNELPPGGRPA